MPSVYYMPRHEMSESYQRAMNLVDEGELDQAVELLLGEPDESPSYGMALGNAALVLTRLERLEDAERTSIDAMAYAERNGCAHPPSWIQFGRIHAQVVRQLGRPVEALGLYEATCELADRLTAKHSDLELELTLQKAHALNEWGSVLLHLDEPVAAEAVFVRARDIYRQFAEVYEVGQAETLTNYAHALRLVGKTAAAELALREALDVATRAGDVDQVARIQLAAIQLGSDLVPEDDVGRTLEAVALAAEREGKYTTAYVRRCVQAQHCAENEDPVAGLAAIRAARGLERHLPESDMNRPRLRLTESVLLRASDASEDLVNGVMIEGANLWFRRLRGGLAEGDVSAAVRAMHDQFRGLAAGLLESGRERESFVAFETGRALEHAIALDPRFFAGLRGMNPFEDGAVDLALLEGLQGDLVDQDCLLTLAVLPPSLVAFVVTRQGVETVQVRMPAGRGELTQLFDSVNLVPGRLQEGKGLRAVPKELRDFAAAVASAMDGLSLTAILPHADLHLVPWRALLRSQGIGWNQLACATEFGAVPRFLGEFPASPTRWTALGHGRAGSGQHSIDLRAEAEAFAEAIGTPSEATLVPTCRVDDVRHALGTGENVLLSCHGAVVQAFDGGRFLKLDLEDGSHAVGSAFPARVAAHTVILSACESGVYGVDWGDFPTGAAPGLLRAGAAACIGARWRIAARFAGKFFPQLAAEVEAGASLEEAFARALSGAEDRGADLWRDLACLELLVSPRPRNEP